MSSEKYLQHSLCPKYMTKYKHEFSDDDDAAAADELFLWNG